jgi:cytoskeleton protein RodZ
LLAEKFPDSTKYALYRQLIMSEQLEENTQDASCKDERDLWPSPGAKLKKLREEMGCSLERVSESLYITVHYVKALENDEYNKLPGATFTKGYFKSYAQFLGADVDEVLTCYQNFVTASEDSVKQENEARKAKSNKKIIVWVLLAFILLAVVLGLAMRFTGKVNAKGSNPFISMSTLTKKTPDNK